jgi:hypothetical protein
MSEEGVEVLEPLGEPDSLPGHITSADWDEVAHICRDDSVILKAKLQCLLLLKNVKICVEDVDCIKFASGLAEG